MINFHDAVNIHNILIDRFGGGRGVRDKRGLESALARPFVTFENTDLYPTTIDKAAAILESIIINHPFIDGNKRIGYVLMRLLLLEAGSDIEASQNDKYTLVISVSKGELKFQEIRAWLIKRQIKKTFL